MADDACSVVKADLEAGTFTRYTTRFSIYNVAKDPFQGGNVYISLNNARRVPEQLVNGPILYHKRSCTINIIANSQTIRDQVYDDVIDILNATNRGYVFERVKDDHFHPALNRTPLEVSMIQ